MSYELQRDETLGDGLRRLCRKQVEIALAFARGEKETDDTPVHETRRHLKKARAALRLVKEEIGRGLFKKQDHCLRDVGRLISEVRDAEVRLQTIRQLQGLTPKHRKYRKLEQLLLLELDNFVAAFAEWHVQAIPILESVRDEISDWPVDQYDHDELRRCLQRSYKDGRKALSEAKQKGTAECFHEFRRAAKDLGYQMRIIRPTSPVVLGNLGADLRALADLLGRAHDLSFLGERLQHERGNRQFERESHELLAVIEASTSDLQRGAADLADRFYAERPRDFGKRITAWLYDWRVANSQSVAEELVNDDRQNSGVLV